jgi:hypothetical protein
MHEPTECLRVRWQRFRIEGARRLAPHTGRGSRRVKWGKAVSESPFVRLEPMLNEPEKVTHSVPGSQWTPCRQLQQCGPAVADSLESNDTVTTEAVHFLFRDVWSCVNHTLNAWLLFKISFWMIVILFKHGKMTEHYNFTGRPELDSRQRQGFFFSLRHRVQTALGPTQTPREHFPGVKRSEQPNPHLELKNVWNFTFTPPTPPHGADLKNRGNFISLFSALITANLKPSCFIQRHFVTAYGTQHQIMTG